MEKNKGPITVETGFDPLNFHVAGGPYLDVDAIYHEALREFMAKHDNTTEKTVRLSLQSITVENYRQGNRSFVATFKAELLDSTGSVVEYVTAEPAKDVEANTPAGEPVEVGGEVA